MANSEAIAVLLYDIFIIYLSHYTMQNACTFLCLKHIIRLYIRILLTRVLRNPSLIVSRMTDNACPN